MKRLAQRMPLWFCMVFRAGALWVLSLLLYFPAFKGVWAGYAPILCGGLLLGVLTSAGAARLASRLAKINTLVFVVALVLLPVVIQSALVIAFRSQPSFDGLFVFREAVELLNTGRMNPLTYYPPAQVWYYAIFFKGFGVSHLTAQLCQIPLAALLPVLIYLIGRQVGSARTARGAALGVALYPSLSLYVLVTPYYFYLYTAFVLLMVWSWLRLQARERDWLSALWGGWAAGCGALAKAVLLIAPLQTIFFLMASAGMFFHRRIWAVWTLFSLAMFATLLPWTVRNVRVFGEPVIICTSGPMVAYSANNPHSNGLYSALPDTAHLETPPDMLAHGKWCREQAWTFIRSQPTAFVRLAWRKMLHTWGTETSYVELINFHGHSLGKWDLALRFLIQTGWAALVLAWATTASLALLRRTPPSALEIATGIIILSKFMIYSVYEGGARHHLPAVPLLILLVAAMIKPKAQPADCPEQDSTAFNADINPNRRRSPWMGARRIFVEQQRKALFSFESFSSVARRAAFGIECPPLNAVAKNPPKTAEESPQWNKSNSACPRAACRKAPSP